MKAKELSELLRKIGACGDAREWTKGKSLDVAWRTCKRADWMLWLCGRMVGKDGWPTRQQIVLVACDIAETALKHFEKKYPDDKRVRNCIEVTRKWANGEATIAEVRSARNAAAADDAAAAYDAAAAAAAYAYDAAAYAAAAAAAVAAAAAYAYDAAAAAVAAAYAYDAARLRTLAKFAVIVRKALKIPTGKDKNV